MASQPYPPASASPRKNSLPSLFSITAAKRLSTRLRKPTKPTKSSPASNIRAPTSPDGEIKIKILPSQAISNIIELPPPQRYRSLGEILSSPRKSLASIFPTRTPRINGLAVTRPHIAGLSTAGEIEELYPWTDATPEGFVLGGDVALFDSNIPAKLYKLLGTARHDGVKELVQLGGDVALKALLPGFSSEITLRDVRLVYQAEIVGQEAGVWLQASTRFEGVMENVGNAVSAVFGINAVCAEMRGYLGQERDWRRPLRPKRFNLQAVLGGGTEAHRRICFTKVGVEIAAEREGRRPAYDVSIRAFGDVFLAFPGSGQHLKMEWTMKEDKPGFWTLMVDKCKEELVGMAGFKGLKVSILFTSTVASDSRC